MKRIGIESIFFFLNFTQGIVIFFLGLNGYDGGEYCSQIITLNIILGSISIFSIVVVVVCVIVASILSKIFSKKKFLLIIRVVLLSLDGFILPKMNTILLIPVNILWSIVFVLMSIYSDECGSDNSVMIYFLLVSTTLTCIVYQVTKCFCENEEVEENDDVEII